MTTSIDQSAISPARRNPLDADLGSDLPTGDLATALEALQDNLSGYHQAHSYYGGSAAEWFASFRLRRALWRSGMNFKFNFAKTPVDAVADRLELAAITGQSQRATKALQDIWADNMLDLEMPRILREACKYGDAYVMVWPSEGGDTDADGFTNVDIFYNGPQGVRVFYDPENPLRKKYAIKRWKVSDDVHRLDLYYADRIEKYVNKSGTHGQEAGDWVRFTDEPGDQWPYANPFGIVPVFHFRTSRPYGVPLHFGFYGPQDAINKLITSHLASVDYQAFPQRYALLGADADTSEAAELDEDEFAIALDTGKTVPPGGDARSQLTADPGSLWQLRGTNSVGEFAAAMPAVFTDPMEIYVRAGAQITSTPLHYFDPSGDAPSGESLRTAEAPFVKKVRNLSLSFGAEARAMFEFALSILGISSSVTVRWAPPQTVDDLAGWQTNQLKIATGVPPRQVLLESGYTVEQVDAWKVPDTSVVTVAPPPPPAPSDAPPEQQTTQG